MKRGSTMFLKGVLILLGIIVILLCAVWLPMYLPYPELEFGYLIAIPFCIALYQAFKLLANIDHNRVFSEISVNALKRIKYCAVVISALVVAATISVLITSGNDMARTTGLGLVLTFASSVIATFAAVLQKLFQTAVDLKAENDLTV